MKASCANKHPPRNVGAGSTFVGGAGAISLWRRRRSTVLKLCTTVLLLLLYLQPSMAFHDPSSIYSKEARRISPGTAGSPATASSTAGSTTTNSTSPSSSTTRSNNDDVPSIKKKASDNKKKNDLVAMEKETHDKSKRPPTSEEAASLRRIQSEWKDMVKAGMAFNWKKQQPVLPKGIERHTPHHVWVGPWSKNLWIWHFSFMGIEGTAFEGGVYHGRLILPKNYPGSPPRVQVFTPTGRFIPRADICLSASHFHPETWTATWTVRTLVESLRLHMLTTANEIGGIEATREQRVAFAKASRQWKASIRPSSIVVDHAAMIDNGLFPAFEYSKEETGDRSNNEAEQRQHTDDSSDVPLLYPVQQRVELLQRERPRGLVAFFRSPLKVALLGLCLLFVVLNTR